MSNKYVKFFNFVTLSDILNSGYILSPSRFKTFTIKNKNILSISDFLDRKLQKKDLGVEVGSTNYITKSNYYFIRTKALQSNSFILDKTKESAIPIKPNVFFEMELKEGDLIISKDSNIGEIIILDQDYPNYMLSGGLYKLPVSNHKYYLLAFIKHDVFREQLDYIVPKGAIIRHAKRLFLDCKIPMPNNDTENTIKYIEILTQAIINKEKLIKQRKEDISAFIEMELLNNQKNNSFKYKFPTYKEIENYTRIDAGIYSEQFKQIKFWIENYNYGFSHLDPKRIKSGSTPTIRYIGNLKSLKYRWITPTHCSDYGILTEERINLMGNNNINEDCILLINRGLGVDVGVAGFYNFKDFGKGHHNQGMYRVVNYEKDKLLFMLCFLNCSLIRKYCESLSVGSKMKELKIEHFLLIPFPNFPEIKQKEISILYHNPHSLYQTDTFTLDNFLEQDNMFNKTAGIYELDKTAKHLKEILNKAIDDIVNDRPVNISFNPLLSVESVEWS